MPELGVEQSPPQRIAKKATANTASAADALECAILSALCSDLSLRNSGKISYHSSCRSGVRMIEVDSCNKTMKRSYES